MTRRVRSLPRRSRYIDISVPVCSNPSIRSVQFELAARSLRYVTQHRLPVVFKGNRLDTSYRIDLIVEDCVIVEVKSITAILPVHHAQILTYMKLTGCPAGLLMNFNVAKLMDGVKRFVNPRVSKQR
jgi:GxxExxY protein